jgi:large subunit ribosomal protein L24
MAAKLKVGDEVVVIAGKDKGKSGIILKKEHRVSRSDVRDLWVVVKGVQEHVKHKKGDPQQGKPGSIIRKEAPIHSSNVLLKNPTTGKADRVGFKSLEDGSKVRFYKSTGAVVVDGVSDGKKE